jgi:hypothetical protein
MIGFWMCPACIGMHIAQVAEASWVSDVIKEIKKKISTVLCLITF